MIFINPDDIYKTITMINILFINFIYCHIFIRLLNAKGLSYAFHIPLFLDLLYISKVKPPSTYTGIS